MNGSTVRSERRWTITAWILAAMQVAVWMLLALGAWRGVERRMSPRPPVELQPVLPAVPVPAVDAGGPPDVYLIPFEGVSEQTRNRLQDYLAGDLDLVVRTTDALPKPEDCFDPKRRQYIANRLCRELRVFATELPERGTNTLFIGILADDMYPADVDWNYCIAQSYADHIMILSTHRLQPVHFLRRERAEQLYGRRVAKMLKRLVLEHYFGMTRTTDPRSLLYAPILSPADVDRMRLTKGRSAHVLETP